MVRAVTPQTPDDEDSIIKPNPKVLQISQAVGDQIRIVRFRDATMVLKHEPYPHFTPLDYEGFKDVAYPVVGAVSHSSIKDAWEYLRHTAEDLTPYEDYILFGRGNIDVDDEGNPVSGDHADAVQTVWDMSALTIDTGFPKDNCIYRSPYARISQKQMFSASPDYPERIPFIMDLACGDENLYDDIMLSIAPIIMKQKPDGVIWWVGTGANGKSTLMDALYDIFPDQLTSMNVKALTESTDLPSLNGYLANVVKESSEGRIDNTENYKSLGTHENFKVHKYYSQSMTTVNANIHHIFSANEIPVFNDKGHSARRRTHIIPFNAVFPSDPSFKQRTFTPQFYGRLISEMCRYANKIARANYVYQWASTITTGVKIEYDADVNTAEAYIDHIVAEGVVAFDNFMPLKSDYENWCAETGVVPLGRNHLSRAAKKAGFTQQSYRPDPDSQPTHHWRLVIADPTTLQKIGPFRMGLYTMPGFENKTVPEPAIPSFHEPKERETVPPDDDADSTYRPTKLKGEW